MTRGTTLTVPNLAGRVSIGLFIWRNDMTSKAIAEAVGKTERSVRNWVVKTAEKSSVVAEKYSASSPIHPADYDIEETCLIIETGLGKNAADLFRMSAGINTPSTDARIDRLESMVEKLCIAVATIPQTINAIAGNQAKQIEFVQDYYSIKGYASKLGHQIAFSEALNIGRAAGKISRDRGIDIRKVDDEAFGQVNSYHVDVLREVFQI